MKSHEKKKNSVVKEEPTSTSGVDERLVQVASRLEACFRSESEWSDVMFGNGPRQLVYTDHSQMSSIDCRCRSVASATSLFKLPNTRCGASLNPHELIRRSCKVRSDHNVYLLACSDTLLAVDQRYAQRPLLAWKHELEPNALNSLHSVSLDGGGGSHNSSQPNIALLSDSKQLMLAHFSLKLNGMPTSHNFPPRLDSSWDFHKHVPATGNQNCGRLLVQTSNQPIASVSCACASSDSFAVFQVSRNNQYVLLFSNSFY